MAKPIANVVIMAAGAVLMVGAAIAVAIVFLYACAVVILRRIKPRPTLTAGA